MPKEIPEPTQDVYEWSTELVLQYTDLAILRSMCLNALVVLNTD